MPSTRAANAAREPRAPRAPRLRVEQGVLALLHAADVVRRGLNKVVEPQGITLQQYNVLRILRAAGGAGLPTLEIAHRMVEQTPGITRLLDRLERKGLVRRERHRKDRRQVLCWTTPRALKLLDVLDRLVLDADRAALKALSADQVETLIQLLDPVRADAG